MNSMTGYGRGEASFDGLRIVIELSSVNRKQAEITLALPRELESLESKIRDYLSHHISRGRVSLRLSVDYGSERSGCRVELNTLLARQYVREIHRLSKDLKIDMVVSLDSLLRAPGVVELHNPLEDPEKLWKTILDSLTAALKALLKMRSKEGSALGRDLRTRISAIKKAAAATAVLAPHCATRYRDALVARLAAAGLPLSLDDDRLIKEVVLFADRSDISEELTRLQSHFTQFEDCLRSKEPVGRKLDFLVQEMNREINTIGSKANDAGIVSLVIEMKTELERFREQAQNVE
jgi:uncharacterized protein (TIGR00255 family)